MESRNCNNANVIGSRGDGDHGGGDDDGISRDGNSEDPDQVSVVEEIGFGSKFDVFDVHFTEKH